MAKESLQAFLKRMASAQDSHVPGYLADMGDFTAEKEGGLNTTDDHKATYQGITAVTWQRYSSEHGRSISFSQAVSEIIDISRRAKNPNSDMGKDYTVSRRRIQQDYYFRDGRFDEFPPPQQVAIYDPAYERGLGPGYSLLAQVASSKLKGGEWEQLKNIPDPAVFHAGGKNADKHSPFDDYLLRIISPDPSRVQDMVHIAPGSNVRMDQVPQILHDEAAHASSSQDLAQRLQRRGIVVEDVDNPRKTDNGGGVGYINTLYLAQLTRKGNIYLFTHNAHGSVKDYSNMLYEEKKKHNDQMTLNGAWNMAWIHGWNSRDQDAQKKAASVLQGITDGAYENTAPGIQAQVTGTRHNAQQMAQTQGYDAQAVGMQARVISPAQKQWEHNQKHGTHDKGAPAVETDIKVELSNGDHLVVIQSKDPNGNTILTVKDTDSINPNGHRYSNANLQPIIRNGQITGYRVQAIGGKVQEIDLDNLPKPGDGSNAYGFGDFAMKDGLLDRDKSKYAVSETELSEVASYTDGKSAVVGKDGKLHVTVDGPTADPTAWAGRFHAQYLAHHKLEEGDIAANGDAEWLIQMKDGVVVAVHYNQQKHQYEVDDKFTREVWKKLGIEVPPHPPSAYKLTMLPPKEGLEQGYELTGPHGSLHVPADAWEGIKDHTPKPFHLFLVDPQLKDGGLDTDASAQVMGDSNTIMSGAVLGPHNKGTVNVNVPQPKVSTVPDGLQPPPVLTDEQRRSQAIDAAAARLKQLHEEAGGQKSGDGISKGFLQAYASDNNRLNYIKDHVHSVYEGKKSSTTDQIAQANIDQRQSLQQLIDVEKALNSITTGTDEEKQASFKHLKELKILGTEKDIQEAVKNLQGAEQRLKQETAHNQALLDKLHQLYARLEKEEANWEKVILDFRNHGFQFTNFDDPNQQAMAALWNSDWKAFGTLYASADDLNASKLQEQGKNVIGNRSDFARDQPHGAIDGAIATAQGKVQEMQGDYHRQQVLASSPDDHSDDRYGTNPYVPKNDDAGADPSKGDTIGKIIGKVTKALGGGDNDKGYVHGNDDKPMPHSHGSGAGDSNGSGAGNGDYGHAPDGHVELKKGKDYYGRPVLLPRFHKDEKKQSSLDTSQQQAPVVLASLDMRLPVQLDAKAPDGAGQTPKGTKPNTTVYLA